MAHIRTIDGSAGSTPGFDPERSLLVVSMQQKRAFYLIAGGDLKASIDPPGDNGTVVTLEELDAKSEKNSSQLDDWEKTNGVRKFQVTGLLPNRSVLFRAKLGDGDFIKPLKIEVVGNSENRRAAGDASGSDISPKLQEELQKGTLREAVLAVAEDQMHSTLGCLAGGGDGRYGLAKGVDWCGAFALWCWQTACNARHATNPFGSDVNALASPQKAISFAYQNPGLLQVVRYNGPMAGADPFGRDFKTGKPLPAAKPRPTELDTKLVEPGDICLVREDGDVKDTNPDGWKHVCMVHSVSGNDFQTLDGNQGFPSIKLTATKSFTSTMNNGAFKFVFVHVK